MQRLDIEIVDERQRPTFSSDKENPNIGGLLDDFDVSTSTRSSFRYFDFVFLYPSVFDFVCVAQLFENGWLVKAM